MLVTYIYHSCYMVELEHHILIFDYFQGELPVLDPSKKLYIFASHAHHDHFSRAIFEIKHPNCTYILSNDIRKTFHKVISIGANETMELGDLYIKTLASTDQGVAFLVTVEGRTIYHAGDLNWWDWGEEDTVEESLTMERDYKREIEKLRGEDIDVAFIVLDPRLSQGYAKGMDTFMEICGAKVVFPMHMWKDYAIIDRLFARKESALYQERIQHVTHVGQIFHLTSF